jgi:hypothetical protein
MASDSSVGLRRFDWSTPIHRANFLPRFVYLIQSGVLISAANERGTINTYVRLLSLAYFFCYYEWSCQSSGSGGKQPPASKTSEIGRRSSPTKSEIRAKLRIEE